MTMDQIHDFTKPKPDRPKTDRYLIPNQWFQQDDETRIEDEWWCKTCGNVLLHLHPEAVKAIEAREMPLYMAECRCPENERKAEEQKHERFDESGLPSTRHTFDDFKHRDGLEEAFKTAQLFAEEKASPILVLKGGVGTGKTHLAEAVGNRMIANGALVRYCQVAAMMGEMYAAMNGEYGALADYLKNITLGRLLILDDLGTGNPTEWALGQILNLIDARIQNRRFLLITTNLITYEASAAVLGPRITDRLFDVTSGSVGQVHIDAESYRHWSE